MTGRRRVALFILLSLVTSLQMLTRSTFTILLPVMKGSMDLSDTYLGLLQGPAGLMLSSLLALHATWIIERYAHETVLKIVIAAWIAATLCCAASQSPALLIVTRVIAAAAEFMMVPVVYSWLPRMAGRGRNFDLNLIFGALVAIGSSAGFVIGPMLVVKLEEVGAHPILGVAASPWRVALMLLAAAGAPLLALTFVPGGRSAAVPAARSGVAAGPGVLLSPRIVRFFAAAGLLSVSVQGTEALLSVALTRRYAATLAQVGAALGASVLVTSLSSFAIVWMLDRVLGRLLALNRQHVMALGMLAAVPTSLLIGSAATLDGAVDLNLAFLFSTCVANALVPTILQDLADPAAYKKLFALFSTVSCAIGSIGPVVVGVGSQHLYGGDLLLAIRLVSASSLILAVAVLLWNATATKDQRFCG